VILYSRTLSTTDLDVIASELGIQVEHGPDFFGPRARRIDVRLFPEGGSDQFRLIRISSYLKSGRRRIHAVCWHGHYAFMRAVFMLDPNAKFRTALDTWDGRQDFFERAAASGHKNIGSMVEPLAYGNACDCWAGQSEIVRRTNEQVTGDQHKIHMGTLTEHGLTDERHIRQADVRACPHFILSPEHYRENGSCRCDDPEADSMKEWGYTWMNGMWQ
jgi:hypothetical protein